MDDNNQRAMQGGESTIDGNGNGNWRNQLQSESRRQMVNEITDTLKKYHPIPGQEGLEELKKIVMRFEEKMYTSAASQGDYYMKIYTKMVALETKYHMPNAVPANSVKIGQNSQDPGSQSVQSQSNSQGPVPTNLSQSGQLLPQNITNNIIAAAIQGSSGLSSELPPISSSSQTNIPGASQSSKTQSIPPVSGVLRNSVPSVIGKGVPLNIIASSQKQIGRQQQGVSQQQRPQLQNSQQYLPKQKIQSQALSGIQSHIQQQEQQQNLFQSNQLHSSQQSVTQPSMMQSSPLSNLQHNQQSSAQHSPQSGFQQHLQSVRQQHHQLLGSQQSASSFLPSQAQKSQQWMTSNQFPNVPDQTQTQEQSQMMSQMQNRGMQQNLQTLQQKQVLQPQRARTEALSTSLDSTAQIGNADCGDWQEETYQKHNPSSATSGISMLPNLKIEQFQHRQMQPNIMHKQLMQQKEQFMQTKLEQPARIQSNQSPMVDHMSDSTNLKTEQPLSVKSSTCQQSAYHQQLKPGNQLPVSSPQLLQPGSLPFLHHGPAQVRQQNMLIALSKAGSLLQPTNSLVVVPSPSTPAVPSLKLGEPEKVNPGVSSSSKAGNVGHQTAGTVVQAQFLAIGTSPESHQAIQATVVSGKSNATEEPLERLDKVVKSMSSKETASVRKIRAVVRLIDEVAGSTPGIESRAAVVEDLVEMTKSPPQATNVITQDETTRRRKNKRYTTATPSDSTSTGSSSDSFQQLNGLYNLSELDSTATSTAKKPKIESGGGSFSSK